MSAPSGTVPCWRVRAPPGTVVRGAVGSGGAGIARAAVSLGAGPGSNTGSSHWRMRCHCARSALTCDGAHRRCSDRVRRSARRSAPRAARRCNGCSTIPPSAGSFRPPWCARPAACPLPRPGSGRSLHAAASAVPRNTRRRTRGRTPSCIPASGSRRRTSPRARDRIRASRRACRARRAPHRPAAARCCADRPPIQRSPSAAARCACAAMPASKAGDRHRRAGPSCRAIRGRRPGAWPACSYRSHPCD